MNAMRSCWSVIISMAGEPSRAAMTSRLSRPRLLMRSMERAISPSSSARSRPGITTSLRPSRISPMAAAICTIGRDMRRASARVRPIRMLTAAAEAPAICQPIRSAGAVISERSIRARTAQSRPNTAAGAAAATTPSRSPANSPTVLPCALTSCSRAMSPSGAKSPLRSLPSMPMRATRPVAPIGAFTADASMSEPMPSTMVPSQPPLTSGMARTSQAVAGPPGAVVGKSARTTVPSPVSASAAFTAAPRNGCRTAAASWTLRPSRVWEAA